MHKHCVITKEILNTDTYADFSQQNGVFAIKPKA